MKIAFAGGGSLGPVTPLLAVANAIRRNTGNGNIEFVWFGTPDGPERQLVETEGIRFYPITVAKLPRYPSVRWITFLFDVWKARSEARVILQKEKPDVIASVGGFTAVPVMKEAKKLGIPCAVHQLDAVLSWSNKAVERFCAVRTSSFAREGYEQIPTPARFGNTGLLRAARNDKKKTILIVGGGTGSAAMNEAILSRQDDWSRIANIIHITGKGKMGNLAEHEGYSVHELLGEEGMRRALMEADLIISRAGIGGLSDIAACSKAAIIVPIPGNQQEENAKRFAEAGAAIVVPQRDGFADALLQAAKKLLSDPEQMELMGSKAHDFFKTDDGSALAQKILDMK
ncbi:glycosyltransferase [Candidatus Uhrbacteria bacterium]|nr:glycosyltransferase [Candidatus Uhrbacteria bacterium]